jgi:bacteriocin biosynthesis cyclodehydratase domain-containing protein
VIERPEPGQRSFLERLQEGYASEADLSAALDEQGGSGADAGTLLAQLEDLALVEREPQHDLLSQQARERYDRQLIYFSDTAGPDASAELMQARLGEASVLILGCGGLGSWTASGLASAGVGSLTLVDDDRVELSNLNRQILFREADVGRPKVEAAREALLASNGRLKLTAVARRIGGAEDLNGLVAGVDLLICTADWPPYELPRWVNEACLQARVPYLSAGQLVPHVRLGPLVVPGQTACLECQERRWRTEHGLYDKLAASRTAKPRTAATLGPATGVIGSMLAMEAIHLLTGACEPASLGRAFMLDLRTLELSSEDAVRDPGCPVCGDI